MRSIGDLPGTRLPVASRQGAHAARVSRGDYLTTVSGSLDTPPMPMHMFGVSPYDPWMLSLSAAVMTGTAVAGAIGPVRRAMRADPAALLRDS